MGYRQEAIQWAAIQASSADGASIDEPRSDRALDLALDCAYCVSFAVSPLRSYREVWAEVECLLREGWEMGGLVWKVLP